MSSVLAPDERSFTMREKENIYPNLSEEELQFLQIIRDPSLSGALLEHLQEIGEIDAFLQAGRETNQAV